MVAQQDVFNVQPTQEHTGIIKSAEPMIVKQVTQLPSMVHAVTFNQLQSTLLLPHTQQVRCCLAHTATIIHLTVDMFGAHQIKSTHLMVQLVCHAQIIQELPQIKATVIMIHAVLTSTKP